MRHAYASTRIDDTKSTTLVTRAGRARTEPAALHFDRTDLTFQLDGPDVLDVSLQVRNPASLATPPQTGRIETAPFGAFLPWTPVKAFEVPPLSAGASTVVRLRVPRPGAGGAGEPPAGGDPDHLDLRSLPRPAELLRRIVAGGVRSPSVGLAGNVNVHVGPKSVERHLSGRFPVLPGRLNVADFRIGRGVDAYRLEFGGTAASWEWVLRKADRRGQWSRRYYASRWYDGADLKSLLFLVFKPPHDCGRSTFEVRVEQHSTGDVAIVEFDLDPAEAAAAI